MDELVEYGDFATAHGITRNWQNYALYSGLVGLAPYVDGAGRRLNARGRAQFWQAFHARPEFVPCAACPHPTIVEADARSATPPESGYQPGSLWSGLEVS